MAMNRQTKRMMAKQGTDKPGGKSSRVRGWEAPSAVRGTEAGEDRPQESTSVK